MNKATNSSAFEQSFIFHMIRDFFALLVLVAVVELGIRYAAVRWDFSRHEPARVASAAQQLANDVKSIMLNAGGPTAARTVYPILNRNYEDLGLSIAVLPSPVTVESIKVQLGMDAKGLQPRWAEGTHTEASVELRAEQFCQGCHVKALLGDVLGTVQVRSYLQRMEAMWWHEVRLTAVALSMKILVHTILLFLLLRIRMEPLLALRQTMSVLARGVMDLSPRATVKGHDEFAELAQDLNHFLDRITQIVHDLDRILSEVVSVGTRLGQVNVQLERQLSGLRDAGIQAVEHGMRQRLDIQRVASREAGAFESLTRTLEDLVAAAPSRPDVVPALGEYLQRIRSSFSAVNSALEVTAAGLAAPEMPSAQYQVFAQSLHDMALLEATMQQVAESGQQVLHRLSQGRQQTAA